MTRLQVFAYGTWPHWMKLAVGATAIYFLAAGMFMLPTADRKQVGGRQTLVNAVALESAINNFHTEYGYLPDIGTHVQTGGPDGVGFLNILLGLESDSTQKQNPGNIKFLAVREAEGRRNGVQYDEHGNRVRGLYDLWGNPYIVEINVKNEEKLRFKFGGRHIELPGRLAAVYSPGKDGKPGTSDDVKTW